MTAADALMALERLGPAAGLDISADGLRRLARLLNDNPSLDPLQFLDEIDPELQNLLDLGIPEEIGPRKKSQGFNLQFVPSAFAATSSDRLNRWVPSPDELGPYTREVRRLLLEEADARIRVSTITGEHAPCFPQIDARRRMAGKLLASVRRGQKQNRSPCIRVRLTSACCRSTKGCGAAFIPATSCGGISITTPEPEAKSCSSLWPITR